MVRGRRLVFEILASDELSRYRTTWSNLARTSSITPFALAGFFDAWCQAFRSSRTGFLVLGFAGRDVEFLLPLWHPHDQAQDWSTLGAFRADYTEAVSRSSDAATATSFWRWLASRAPCHSARVARIPVDSFLGANIPASAFEPRRRMIAAAASILTSRKVRYLTTHPHDEHPFADRSQIEAMADRLQRSATRRNLKMLEKHGAVVYETVFETRTLSKLLPTLFEMHVANFAGTGRSSQFERMEERAFFETLVTRPDLDGIIYMDVLRAGGRPVAMHLGFQHGNRIYYSKPAFDLELAKASPGKSLLAHLFSRAKAQNIQRIDLLKGNEPYKAEWANLSRPTITTMLVQRSVRDLVHAVVRRS